MDASTSAKRLSRWVFVGMASGAVSLALFGCDEPAAQAAKGQAAEPAAQEAEGPKTATEQTAPTPAASSYEEDAFTLTLSPPKAIVAGKEAEFVIELSARGGYKVNDEYPIKFQVAEAKGVVAKKTTVRKEDGKVETKTAQLPVVVTVEKPGKATVAGKLSFSVCTEERCLIEKRDLSVSVDAS